MRLPCSATRSVRWSACFTAEGAGPCAPASSHKQALGERLLVEPYFVPSTTPVLAQLQYFQENKERIALVVDYYGELMPVTLEDIIDEIIGKLHHLAAFGDADPRLGRAGHRHAEGTMRCATSTGRWASICRRRTEDPQRADRRAPQDIPRPTFPSRSQRADGIVACPGRTVKTVGIFRPSSQSKTPSPQSLEQVFQALQTSPRGHYRPQKPGGLFIWQQRCGGKRTQRIYLRWEGKDRAARSFAANCARSARPPSMPPCGGSGILGQKVKRQKIRSGGRVSEKDLALFTRSRDDDEGRRSAAAVVHIAARAPSNPAVQKLLLEI